MSYNPANGAVAEGIQGTRLLSQRDLSLNIPLNYVTVAGVVLKQACFAENKYELNAAAKCFSNLLAIGYQRFELDIYWDASRQVWSLCPVELGYGSSKAARAVIPAVTGCFESFGFNEDFLETDAFANDGGGNAYHRRRQDGTTSDDDGAPGSASTRLTGSTLVGPTTTSPTDTIPTNSTPINARPTSSGGVIEIGPYSCTPSLSFQALLQVFLMHLDDTQTNVNATIKTMIINLHASAPASDPTGPSQAPPLGNLPHGDKVLSYILDQSMSEYLYTPGELALQRSNLNSSQSWFGVVRFDEPDSSYFQVNDNDGDSSTPDGWPSASFVEMQRAKRLLTGFGRIDPQMDRYNFSADKTIIFSSDYLQTPLSNDSYLPDVSNCFFDPNEKSVSAINNSWAFAWDEDSPPLDFTSAYNYTACGISTILNTTLKGQTADQEYGPYIQFLQHTIWSWGPGEPQGSHMPKEHNDNDDHTAHRCAVLNGGTGFWQTADCSESHYSACRKSGQPYEWLIGSTDTSYDKADLTCPEGTIFTAPRTALENGYLAHKWRTARDDRDIDDSLLYVNFNDLDVEGCWVVGQNVTCPYLNTGNDDRQIIVPTVAAVIVFVLALLTICVKCAGNRQRSKRRRRRGDDGWDYEGVPS